MTADSGGTDLKARVAAYVVECAEAGASKRAVREEVFGRNASKDAALAELVAEGFLVLVGGHFRIAPRR